MAYLDIERWNRREHFHMFRAYERPFFNLCAPVDVTRLRERCRGSDGPSFSIAAFWLSLRAANGVEAFRYRLRTGERDGEKQGDRVWIHDSIDGGSTILRRDETFGFAYFPYTPTFAEFAAAAEPEIERIVHSTLLDPKSDDDALIHYSVIPWVSFTSFAHARRFDATDSVPKIVFGRFYEEGGRWRMPVSVEVHHALADGLHVGRFFQHFQALLDDPPLG
jgi:chloramphenicol O-acetyltransferase type A